MGFSAVRLRELGHKTYHGKACIRCNGTLRYTRNWQCVGCRAESKRSGPPKKRGRPRKNPDAVVVYERRWPKYPKPKDSFDLWVLRSKRKNKERRMLRYEDFLAIRVTHCPLLNIELSYEQYDGKDTPDNYATLDRIDSSLGYTPNNIQILSKRANTLKNDSTIEELSLLLENWKRLKQGIFSEKSVDGDVTLSVKE